MIWACEVLTNRLLHQNSVRIAACVAFLACSLMGKPLHELQHLDHPEHCVSDGQRDAFQGKSTSSHCGQSCGSHLHTSEGAQDKSGSPTDPHGSGEGDPHDSHDCSVCQALCISATSPDGCVAVTRPDLAVPLDAIDSESVTRAAPQTADARGPPGLA
jgi:hypothetical protein